MNVALVQDAQHDVDDADRDEEQQVQIPRGLLKDLRGAFERERDRRRHCLARDVADALHRGAERDARTQRERDRDRRELSRMIDALRTDRFVRREHGRQRHHAAARRPERQAIERIGVGLVARIDFEQHFVLRRCPRRSSRTTSDRSRSTARSAAAIASRPRAAALSRSIASVTCGLFSWRSVDTSWISGTCSIAGLELARGLDTARRCSHSAPTRCTCCRRRVRQSAAPAAGSRTPAGSGSSGAAAGARARSAVRISSVDAAGPGSP